MMCRYFVSFPSALVLYGLIHIGLLAPFGFQFPEPG